MATKYYIVEASALPDVILRTAEANRLLQTGRAATIGEAARKMGISRSAYYKYRDAIRPFLDSRSAEMVTLHMVLTDEPGVLSGILGIFASCGANILTINQSIPVNGVASVSVSADTAGMTCEIDELIDRIERFEGVEKTEIIAG